MNLFSMYEHEKGFSFAEEMSTEMGFDFSLFSVLFLLSRESGGREGKAIYEQ